MVEGTSREQAIGHVTRPLVEECKAASAKDVMEFARGGGTIEKAGIYPEPEKPLPLRRQPQVGDVIIELTEDVKVHPGDYVVPEGAFFRKIGEDDAFREDAVMIPDSAEQFDRVVFWTPVAAGQQNPAPEGA